MRQPLWAINSSLLFLCILGQLVFLFLHTPPARRTSLEPDTIPLIDTKVNATVDIVKIYGTNDLFETYIPVNMQPKMIEPDIPVMPNVPALIPLTIPVEAPKVFIPPLPVTLKGVMYMHDRPAQNVAIIQFQDSKEEMNYHVGQLINDAQILKIYPNRIIVVRSNGQKETLYLRENDASKDLALETAKEISALTIEIKSGIYQIPVEIMVKQIKGLGQFIDLLDLTTLYKKGKSIGCRVGKTDKDSLGSKLGFIYDDIIQQVDGLPITDIASRVLAFDHTITKKVGDTVMVQVERSGKTFTLKYELVHSTEQQKTPEETTPTAKQKTADQQFLYNVEQQRTQMLAQKVKLAPTAHQLEIEERKKMFQARHKALQQHSSQSATLNHNVTGAKG